MGQFLFYPKFAMQTDAHGPWASEQANQSAVCRQFYPKYPTKITADIRGVICEYDTNCEQELTVK